MCFQGHAKAKAVADSYDKKAEEALEPQKPTASVAVADTVTKEHIESIIKAETYNFPAGTTLTICLLTLVNGFTIVGTSASVSETKFDPKIGKDIAHDNAIEKIWELEGYLLKQKQYELTTLGAQSNG
jgi:hypothetical protein